MKKLGRILLPFVCLNACLLSGCGNDSKIQLSFGNIHATAVEEKFTVVELDRKVESDESFLLVVADTTCACWSDFRPIINSYVKDNHVDCFFLTYDYFADYASKYKIELTKGTTKFIIFEKGEAKIQIKSTVEDKTMKDKAAFYKFMEGNVKLPKAYFINEGDYGEVTKNGAIIYFERSGCGDCSYLNPTVLANYVKKHPNMNNIYVIDCQWWKDDLDPVSYQAKKNNYGLSDCNNPEYGYDDGVFPFFSFVKKGYYLSGAVAFNDEVSKVNGKYVITNSYYDEDRLERFDYLANVQTKVLEGMELPASDVSDNGEWISWMQDKAVKYYEPIIDAFLDTYLPQVNYTL